MCSASLMRWLRRSNPGLSIVVVVYDMKREAPRTLRSLAPGYQQHMSVDDYEVVVVDNGSPEPLGADLVTAISPNFRYVYLEDESASPVGAINRGVEVSCGAMVGIWIDGARIASPGVLRRVTEVRKVCKNPVVATLGFHLGPKPQQISTTEGYDEVTEDRLLESVEWQHHGYRLFDISVLAGSAKHGFFVAPPAESNALFLERAHFDALGGYESRFTSRGGGLANLDFFKRAVEFHDSRLIVLLGEGTFHQVHGGISTNVSATKNSENWRRWNEEYRQIRGEDWCLPEAVPIYYGELRPDMRKHLRHSLDALLALDGDGT